MGQFDNVKFRTFDYDGFKQVFFDLAAADPDFPQWTDTLESNQGVMFVEWLAYVGGNLVFSQNYQARQSFVPTATEAASIAKLSKQYGYPIPNNTPATVDLTISKLDGGNFSADMIIPAGTQFLTQGTTKLIWETLEELHIFSGDLSGEVASANQESKQQFDVSDGQADFTTRASFGPYIEDSAVVKVNDVTWTRVDNFLDSTSSSEHFTVEVESNGIAVIIFGDGTNGLIPPVSAQIDFSYKVGGGTQGKIPPGTVTEVPFAALDVNNNPVDIVVTNLLASEGGTDRESITVSKYRMPASLSSREVTVNKEDFKFFIESIAGVARTSINTVNDNEDIPENTVIAVVLPEEDDTVSDALQLQIEAVIAANPPPLTQLFIVAGPQFRTIEIDIRDLEFRTQFDDGTGAFAETEVQILDNTFAAGDAVIVNGLSFEKTTHWAVGATIADTAINIADAVNASEDPLVHDIEALADDDIIVFRARTLGVQGNSYTLAVTDTATTNFTVSSAVFANGEENTVQLAIRAMFDEYFGRSHRDENGDYTTDFGQPVFRNDLIWQIRDLTIEGLAPVVSFILNAPEGDTDMDTNEFPKYTLIFSTTRDYEL